LRDSIPVFIDFIEQVYNEKSAAKHNNSGIILMGHSLGGGFALAVTHESRGRLPVLGVSSMGCLPTLKYVRIIPEPESEPENPRYVTENTPENIKKYMGEIDWVNVDALTKELIDAVFEPGVSL
jgi:acetyl esterase/lipase